MWKVKGTCQLCFLTCNKISYHLWIYIITYNKILNLKKYSIYYFTCYIIY